MRIGNVDIGPGFPTYVIAEIGSNHGGDLATAFRLIELAANAGADCAKFQFFNGDTLYPGQWTPGSVEARWLPELKACCHEEGVEFMCSVFDGGTLEAYMEVEPAAIKIASPEANDLTLVGACAKTGLPLIVSTGAMTRDEFRLLNSFLWQVTGYGHNYALLHCVSAYPASPKDLNLRFLRTAAFDDPETGDGLYAPVGLSDHTMDEVMVPALAVACGASILEKHLTYDRNAEGADHAFALTPDEFQCMVEVVRETETILGDGVKRVQPSEDPLDRRQAA